MAIRKYPKGTQFVTGRGVLFGLRYYKFKDGDLMHFSCSRNEWFYSGRSLDQVKAEPYFRELEDGEVDETVTPDHS